MSEWLEWILQEGRLESRGPAYSHQYSVSAMPTNSDYRQ